MKKLIITMIMLCSTAILFAQTAKTTSTGTTEKSTVSISDSDNDYSLTASFSKNQADQTRLLVTRAIGNAETNTENLTIWSSGAVYTVILKPEHVMISLDKRTASGELIRTFTKLGKDIQNLQISSHPHRTAIRN